MLVFGSLFLAVISLTQAISIRKENSLTGPYIHGGENLVYWDLTGNAQLGGSFIRLTADDVEDIEKQGAIWNNFPSISNNWEFQTMFRIHGKGVYLYGDGMALWYVRDTDMLHRGPVFGSKDYFSGLGIFIDTFENQAEPHKVKHRHPYISGMVNNGTLHYAHDEDGSMTQIGGCHVVVRNLDVPSKIAVSYINNNLAVYVDSEGQGQWKVCFKSEGVHLPTGYHFGISASTSDASDNHDVLSITTLNLDPEGQEWDDRSDIIPQAENIEIPAKYHKKFIEEELQKVDKREMKEEEEEADHEEESEAAESPTEDTSPPTSLLRKLIYITGASVVVLISISVYKKYSERRRERMQKRLF